VAADQGQTTGEAQIPGTSGAALAELIKSFIRDVPDYPLPGIMFKDITPLLGDPAMLRKVVAALGTGFGRVDKVTGIEARGFILAAPVACLLGTGFVPVRKQGKLPAATYAESYELEYGTATIEVHKDAFTPGERVLIVDDVLATGGAAAGLVRQAGAEVAGVSVLLELAALNGRAELAGLELRALLSA
jgi:adenine phosphoribosyltransferase